MAHNKIRDLRSSVSVKNCPRNCFVSETVMQEVKNDYGVGIGKWAVMSILLSQNRESESLFDCKQEEGRENLFDCEQEGRESLFDCEEEEELKIVIKYKEKSFSSWDNNIVRVNFERKIKALDGYVKQLVKTHDLDATEKIKEMIVGDSKLADGLEPLVLKSLVEILVEILDGNNNESTKGSAACILAFANFDKCGDDIKGKAIQALVKLMSDDRDTIYIPVLRTLTRLAYLSTDYASFIIENGAIEVVCAANVEPVSSSLKRIQNLAKFLVVIVRRVQLSDYKLRAVVPVLDKILEVRRFHDFNLRCIVRACYTLSCIDVELWVTDENILNNIIELIRHYDEMIAHCALRVAAKIVKSEKSREILTKNFKFFQYLGWSKIYHRPKKFQKEACDIISDMVASGGTSRKDLVKSGLMVALFELLKVDDVDVKSWAVCTLHNVIRCQTRDATIS